MRKNISIFAHCCFNISVFFEELLDVNELFNSVDHLLHEFDLREANALLVGHVPLATWACRGVFAVAAARLHALALGEFFQLVRGQLFGELRQENHGGGS